MGRRGTSRNSDRAFFLTSHKLFLLLCGFALIAILLVLEFYRVESGELDLLESERTADQSALVQAVIRLSGESLEAYAREFSGRTEMATFVHRRDTLWVHQAISRSLAVHGADVAFVLDRSWDRLFAMAVSAHRDLIADQPLLNVMTTSAPWHGLYHGFTVSGSKLIELRGGPIHCSDHTLGETDTAGYFVAGRVWDNEFLAGLSRTIGAGLSLASPTGLSLGTAGQSDRPNSRFFQIPLQLNGATSDLQATLRVSFDASDTEALSSDIHQQLAVVLLFALAIVAVFGLFLRKWVSKPLGLVRDSLVGEDPGPLAVLSSDGSEFGSIAQRIVSSIQERKRLREQEVRLAATDKRIRTIVDLTGQVFYDTNLTTGEINLLGPVEGITGYPIDIFPGRTLKGWRQCIHADDRDRVTQLRQSAIETNGILNVAYRIWRQDGSAAVVEQSGCVVQDVVTGESHFLGTIKDVTAREVAENALREGQHFLSSIVENLPTMLFVKDARDLRFLIFNRAGAQLVGRSVDDFVGKTDYDLFRKDDADFFVACDRSVLEERKLIDIPEETISTINGTERILHTRKIPILDQGGNPKFLLGISEDITEKKIIEQKLCDSENKFRTIFDHAPDATLLIDDLIIDCNEVACDLFGYSRKELLTRSILDLSPETQPDGRLSREIVKGGASLALTTAFEPRHWLFQTKSGGAVDTEVTLTRMMLGDRDVLLASIRDITSRRKAEQQIRLLATAVSQSADGLVITDRHGCIEYVNPAFEKMTQYRFDEVLGANPRLLKSGKQDDSFYHAMWTTLLSGKTWQGRLENRRKDGTTYLEYSTISPVQDSAGKCTHFVAVKRDVSHEVALEGMLVQSQKMEAIGRLAGGVAHDFNNILTAILGYSDALIRHLKDDARSQSDATEIQKAATRASALTKQLLAFSRRQTLRKEHINLYDLVVDMTPMLRQLIGESVSLEVVSEDRQLRVLADATHIQQVVLNLAVNAKDAMPDGGALHVRIVEEEWSDRRSIGRFELAPGEYVVLHVSDTGKGMDETILSHLFEPFFTTKGIGKGTGLGLATVYGIVDQSGGAIAVTSTVGEGTTFRVFFPRAYPTPETSPDSLPQTAKVLQG